jgi:hypothetical protein
MSSDFAGVVLFLTLNGSAAFAAVLGAWTGDFFLGDAMVYLAGLRIDQFFWPFKENRGSC